MYVNGVLNKMISSYNTFDKNFANVGGGVITYELINDLVMLNTTFSNNYA